MYYSIQDRRGELKKTCWYETKLEKQRTVKKTGKIKIVQTQAGQAVLK